MGLGTRLVLRIASFAVGAVLVALAVGITSAAISDADSASRGTLAVIFLGFTGMVFIFASLAPWPDMKD